MLYVSIVNKNISLGIRKITENIVPLRGRKPFINSVKSCPFVSYKLRRV